jgi:hypothetical protein
MHSEAEMAGSGDVCTLRQKWLDLESVAELEQSRTRWTCRGRYSGSLRTKKELLEQRTQVQDSFITQRNNIGSILKVPCYAISSLLHVQQTSDSYWLMEPQSLFEPIGVTLPLFPKLSLAMASLLVHK